MLHNLKIGKRLLLIVVTVFVGILSLAYMNLQNLKATMLEDRQTMTQSLVEAEVNVAKGYFERAKKGEFSEEEAQKRALHSIFSAKYDKGVGYFFVQTMDGGRYGFAPSEDGTGLVLKKEMTLEQKDAHGFAFVRAFIDAAKNGGGFVNYFWVKTKTGAAADSSQKASPKLSYVGLFEPWEWIVGTGIYIDDVDAAYMENALVVGGFAAGLLLIVGFVSTIIGRGVTRPLGEITSKMGLLADGDKTIVVNFKENKDEIGDLARALETFKDNAIRVERLEKEQQENKIRAEQEQRKLMLKMADDFDASVKGVVTTVSSAATEMQSSAKTMAGIADGTSRQSATVAAAAEQASSNIQTVASAAEELNASIGEINRQIGDSVKVASACVVEAEATGAVMQSLSKSADDIGNVVKLIEDIASQVNLLALNATIEAARAGDAGRGFAVVANEVKNLANQVGNAAQDITRQISGIQGQTTQAVQTIDGITKTIKRINEISTAIAAAVEEQGAATKEISRSIQETAEGTSEVTRNISGVTQAAQETGTASGQLLETAGQLAHESETLRTVVESFISHIREG